MRSLLLTLILALYLNASNSAVILLYHHIDTRTPKITSVSPELFKKHLEYLKENNYNVLALEDILNKLSLKQELPSKTVAITFDDAYKSIFYEANALLQEFNFPYTVFVNTAPLDNKGGSYLTWEQVRELVNQGVSIGSHSHTHDFLIRYKEDENEIAYTKRVREDINTSIEIIKEKTNLDVTMFAYPFGEYTKVLQNIVQSFSLYGIAQKSAPIGKNFNTFAVSRFPMMDKYASMERFKLVIDTKAFNVIEERVEKRVMLEEELEDKSFILKIKKDDFDASSINCFSNGERLDINKSITSSSIDITMQLPLWKEGRAKINCTAPSLSTNSFYWYSNLWIIKAKNRWYKD